MLFRKIVETVVGGAVGLLALYVVAKVAYSAGHEMAEAERRYDELTSLEHENTKDSDEETRRIEGKFPKKETKHNPLGLFFGLKKLIGKGSRSVIGDLVNDPENHKLEAYVDEGEVHINIKKRRSLHPVT